jgi:hypothetical protein
LVQNAGHPKRDAAWDLTFSAPKSVSVLWALVPEPIRQQIEQAHQAAVGAGDVLRAAQGTVSAPVRTSRITPV